MPGLFLALMLPLGHFVVVVWRNAIAGKAVQSI
jgi:hypothetical protein